MPNSTKAKKPRKSPVERRNTTHEQLMREKPVMDAVLDAINTAKDDHIAATILSQPLEIPPKVQ